MSTTIDQKVVEMRFDNKQFENNVQTSLNTLDKLRGSLDMTGAAKGFDNINSAVRGVNMNGLGSAVEQVGIKFNWMYSVADQALRNITNSVMNTSKKMISALTIDPVKTGFSEYETKINAVQTIMSNTASKGTTMDDVTRVLDELNTYADKTIYNFAEMTRNIGTFTAAGIGLEESASAIQGIANLAASSGSSSQQASTAMYQLSQALSTGTVRLMDWNSVVNAGMGGELFQEALKATAREHGVAVDDIIEKNGSFRDSLQDGWLSAEILNTTLQKFTTGGAKEYADSMVKAGKWTQAEADALLKQAQSMEDAATKVKTFTQLWDTLKESAQSGWSQTWEILIGDFEEAKETLTEFSKVIGGVLEASAKARNEVLQGWKDAGGRADLVDSLFNVVYAIGDIVKPIKEAFQEIFPPLTVRQLTDFTSGLKELTGRFRELVSTSDVFDKIKRTFKGLFAVFDIVRMVITSVLGAVFSLAGGVGELGGGILSVTATIGDWLVKLRGAIIQSNVLGIVFGTMAKIIRGAIGAVVGIFKALGPTAKAVGEAVYSVFASLGPVIHAVADAFKVFGGWLKEKLIFPGLEAFQGVLNRVKARMAQIGDAAVSMKDGVTNAVSNMSAAIVNSKFGSAMLKIWEVVKKVGKTIGEVFGNIFSWIGKKMGDIKFDAIFDAINVASLGAIALAIKKFLDSATKPFDSFKGLFDGLKGIMGGVKGVLDSVRGCFEAYQTKLKADALTKIATAIAILVASILVLSFVNSDGLTMAIAAVTAMFADLTIALSSLEKTTLNPTALIKITTGLIGLSVAVFIMASALKKLAKLDPDGVMNGMLSVVALTATMVVAAKSLSKDSGAAIKGAMQMVAFAIAIRVLAGVTKTMSKMNWSEMGKGLVGVAGLMASVVAFTRLAGSSGISVGTGVAMIAIAAAMKILASVCKDFAGMKWEDIGKGVTGVTGLLVSLGVFTKLSGSTKGMLTTSIGLIAIGGAMKIFTSIIRDMAGMSWEEIGKGLTGIAGALAAITLALAFMPKDTIVIAAGLAIVAGSLTLLTQSLISMSGMSWEAIAKGIVTLAGSMAILVVALNLMTGTLAGSAALLIAAGALAILAPVLTTLGAMSWESVAIGLVAIAGAFAVMGVAGLLLGPLVPVILSLTGALALIGVAALGVGGGILMAGVGLTMLATALAAFAAALSAHSAVIVAGLGAIILGIAELIPTIAVKIGEGIIMFAQVIANGAPVIGEAVKSVVLTLLDTIRTIIPALAETVLLIATELLMLIAQYTPQIVQSVIDILLAILRGLRDNIAEVTATAIDVVLAFLNGVSQKLPDIIDAGFNLIINFIDGLADAIDKNTDRLIEAGNKLFKALLDAAVKLLTNGISKVKEVGGKLMNGLKEGISDKVSDIKEAVSDAMSKAKEKLSEWIDKFKSVGKDIMNGLVDGVKAKIDSVVSTVKSAGEQALEGIKKLLGIKSPSRAFMEVGKYSGEGLIVGLEKCTGKITSAAEGMGDAALDSMRGVMSGIASAIESDVDTQPTIRPVLDLSDVESGAGAISGMFGMTPSVGVLSNVGAIGTMMSRRQNGGNSDVISAINDLKSALGGSRGDTYMLNGIEYSEGDDVADALKTIVRAAKAERRK
jgi:tape measure domain-containing protein